MSIQRIRYVYEGPAKKDEDGDWMAVDSAGNILVGFLAPENLREDVRDRYTVEILEGPYVEGDYYIDGDGDVFRRLKNGWSDNGEIRSNGWPTKPMRRLVIEGEAS